MVTIYYSTNNNIVVTTIMANVFSLCRNFQMLQNQKIKPLLLTNLNIVNLSYIKVPTKIKFDVK